MKKYFALFLSFALCLPLVVFAGALPMREVGSVQLGPGEDIISGAILDSANGYAYFGTNTDPGKIVQIDLGNRTGRTFRKVTTLSLPSSDVSVQTAVFDKRSGMAYFGMGTDSNVVKVQLSPLQRLSRLHVTPGIQLRSSVIDTAGGFAYFGTYTYDSAPDYIMRINLSDFTPTGVSFLDLDSGDNLLASAVIDPGNEPDHGFAYFGTDTAPARIIKVSLRDFVKVGELQLANVSQASTMSIDPANGFIYVGTFDNPPKIVKLDVGRSSRSSTFQKVGELQLNADEALIGTSFIDLVNQFAYFGSLFSDPAPAYIVKINLSNFTRVTGRLQLTLGKVNLKSCVFEPADGHAYLGTQTSPGRIVKVQVADPESTTSTPPAAPRGFRLVA